MKGVSLKMAWTVMNGPYDEQPCCLTEEAYCCLADTYQRMERGGLPVQKETPSAGFNYQPAM